MTLAAFVGCQVNELAPEVSDSALPEAEMVNIFVGMEEDVQTRTSTNDAMETLWSEDDKLNFFCGINNTNKDFYLLVEGEGTKNGTFYGPHYVVPETQRDDLHQSVLVYPYSEEVTCTPNADKTEYTIDGLNIPAVQEYTENSFANGAHPMVAVAKNANEISFGAKNTNAALRIAMTGTHKIKKIVIESEDGHYLAGPASVVASYGSDPVITVAENGSKTVVMNFAESVQLNESEATYFYFTFAPVEGRIIATIYADTAKGDYSKKVFYTDEGKFVRNGHLKPEAFEFTPKNSVEGDLVNAFKNGTDYTLPLNVSISKELVLPAGKSTTLDLNGYTLTVSTTQNSNYGAIYARASSKLRIVNGTLKYTGDKYLLGAFEFNSTSLLELTDVVAECTANEKGRFVSINYGGANIVLNNVTATASRDVFTWYNQKPGSTLPGIVINGGKYRTLRKNSGVIFSNIYGNVPVTFKGDCLFSEKSYNGAVWESTGDTTYPWRPNGVSQPDENTVNISNSTGLAWVAEQVNTGAEDFAGKTINLMADLDLSPARATRSAAVSNWTPIGTEEKPFKGEFNGNGYTIKNLNLVESEAKEGKAFIGFFGYAKDATIKNVTFENVYINIPCLDIDHSQGHIGAVAGSLEGTSTIENVIVKGDIKVEATVTANGASRVAVVAGGNSYGNVTMKNVHVNANDGSYLKANNNVGALAGQLQGKSVFENCSSNIDVTGTKFFAGGIIGLAAGDQTFTNCHTTGNVTITAGRLGKAHDHYRVGGIAGGWADGAKNVCTLTNCSYTGALSGTNADGSVAEVFDYEGYVGRGYTLNGCKGSKVIIDGVEYVQAYDTAAEAGIYTVDGVYEIATASALKFFADKVNAGDDYFAGKTLILVNDIDLANVEWTPIGSAYKDHGFMGNFDGNGMTIKNLKMTQLTPDADGYVYAGLFGVTEGTDKDNSNFIKNLTIENVNIQTNGHIVAAAIAYPYYTKLENITVKGNVNIKGGDYTSGVLAYTRRCVDANNITIAANDGSSIEGKSTVGGVISDIQMNGGLTANYSNFAASGLTIKANQLVGGIAGIISNQTLNGATVKNVTIVGGDARTGIVTGSYDGDYNVTDVTYEDVEGATRLFGASYKGAYFVGKIIECAGVKGVIYEITKDAVKVVSVAELNLNGKTWQNAMDWAAGLGEGWSLASMEELNAIYDLRCELNVALKADNAENALFWEGDELYRKNGSIYYANYMSSTEVPVDGADANGNAYFPNRVFFKQFNARGYSDVLYSAFDCINKYAPLRDNHYARATYTVAR